MHARLDWIAPTKPRADPLRGLVAGTLAGLLASGFMNGFQALTADLKPKSDEPPATEVAADKVAVVTTGQQVTDSKTRLAGNLVHYAFGAALGGAYGLAAETMPGVTAGGGSVFGTTAALLFDEWAVPALGLSPPASESPPATHAWGIASHLVFGMGTEALRRVLRG